MDYCNAFKCPNRVTCARYVDADYIYLESKPIRLESLGTLTKTENGEYFTCPYYYRRNVPVFTRKKESK